MGILQGTTYIRPNWQNRFSGWDCNARMRRTSVFTKLLGGFRFCQSLKYLFRHYYAEADIFKLLCNMYRSCTLGFYTVNRITKRTSNHTAYHVHSIYYILILIKDLTVIGARVRFNLSHIPTGLRRGL